MAGGSSTTYNADNEQTKFGGATLAYDANGNLSSGSGSTYTFDARNHLTAISTGGNSASFVYDPFGRRMKKTVNSAVTQYIHDGLNPVQLLNGAVPPAVTANLLDGLNIDEYFKSSTNGGLTFLSDGLGLTIGLVNASGAIVTSYSYQPFGKTTVSGSATTPFEFTGRENDGTGLYFYRARYYSPTYQRFIAQDPIGFGGGINLYGAMSDDPVDYLDHLGLSWLIFPVAPGGGTPWVYIVHYPDDPNVDLFGWDIILPDSLGIYRLDTNFNQIPFPCQFPGLACLVPEPFLQPKSACASPPNNGPPT